MKIEVETFLHQITLVGRDVTVGGRRGYILALAPKGVSRSFRVPLEYGLTLNEDRQIEMETGE